MSEINLQYVFCNSKSEMVSRHSGQSLMNKTVLITGASSGIGEATTRLFAQQGWNVIATVRSPERATELAQLEQVTVLRLDVTDPETIKAAIDQALAQFPSIDVLVNNAGYALVGPFEAATPAQIEQQFATNVFGLMNVTHALLSHFRDRKQGLIINVASMGGRITFPLYSLYHATKWAVEGFSESLQYELAPLGIRVKTIEPGPIKTDFYGRSNDVLSQAGLTVYDAFMKRTMPKMQHAGETGAPPKAVAQVIYGAAIDNSKKFRYSVNSTLVLGLRKLLPDGLFFSIIRRAVL
jgi:NAD(P)-dependent dehydrogenase (short-subunit alcohol dehydrogenase family)